MNEWTDSDRQKLSYLRVISPYLSPDQRESRSQLEEKHRQVFGETFPASIRAMISAVGAKDEYSIYYKVRNLLDREEDMTMNWSDSQRAQLLQIYKDKITQLGEEEFFTKFDEIREEAHRTIGVEADLDFSKTVVESTPPYSSRSIPYYIDPIHSSASTLGRLGGRSKSEAKARAVKENGKKGGRPSVKQLDLEEI